MYAQSILIIVFFFNDTATTEIYTLSLHDALPIFHRRARLHSRQPCAGTPETQSRGRHLMRGHLRRLLLPAARDQDRKSARLNSSHANISYAVFCLKKKKTLLNRYLSSLDYLEL